MLAVVLVFLPSSVAEGEEREVGDVWEMGGVVRR